MKPASCCGQWTRRWRLSDGTLARPKRCIGSVQAKEHFVFFPFRFGAPAARQTGMEKELGGEAVFPGWRPGRPCPGLVCFPLSGEWRLHKVEISEARKLPTFMAFEMVAKFVAWGIQAWIFVLLSFDRSGFASARPLRDEVRG